MTQRDTASGTSTKERGTAEPARECYWCARKRLGFIDEFRGNAPLDAVFFAKLEEVGRVRLAERERKYLAGALLRYSDRMHRGSRNADWYRSMRRMLQHAEGFIREAERHEGWKSWMELRVFPPWLEKRGSEWWDDFTAVLVDIKAKSERSLAQKTGPRRFNRHRPKNERLNLLIYECGLVYIRAGGRAKISNNAGIYQGPYAAFLKVIWDVIPKDIRPPNPNAFAVRHQHL